MKYIWVTRLRESDLFSPSVEWKILQRHRALSSFVFIGEDYNYIYDFITSSTFQVHLHYILVRRCSDISNWPPVSQSTEHYGHQETRLRQNCKTTPEPRKTCCVLAFRKINVLFRECAYSFGEICDES